MAIEYKGPIFNGQGNSVLAKAADEIERRVAVLGASMIRSELNRVLKVQTPYYRLQNEATKDGGHWKIWDRGVIYGPWLEGVGSRNSPVTRFKGYATYRRTAQKIDARAEVISEYTIREFLPAMGGK